MFKKHIIMFSIQIAVWECTPFSDTPISSKNSKPPKQQKRQTHLTGGTPIAPGLSPVAFACSSERPSCRS